MAQAQRMIDDNRVQIPNVRAWRPFTGITGWKNKQIKICKNIKTTHQFIWE